MASPQNWMDAIPAAQPTAAMRMLGAGGAAPAAPAAAGTSWMDAMPTVVLPFQAASTGSSLPPAARAQAPSASSATAALPDNIAPGLPNDTPPASAAQPDTSWMDAMPSVRMPLAMQLMQQQNAAQQGGSGQQQDPGAGAAFVGGAQKATADLLGFPAWAADTVTNLPIEGANALFGTHIPTFDPNAGSRLALQGLRGAGNLVARGINAVTGSDIPTWQTTGDVPEPTELDRIAGAAGQGAAMMAEPWGVARAVPELIGAEGIPAASTLSRGAETSSLPRAVAGSAQKMLGAGSASRAAAVGAVGGATGQGASDSSYVPAPYKPLANLAGNIVGGGLTAGGGAALDAAGPKLVSSAAQYIQPLREGNATTPLGRAVDWAAAGGRQAAAGQRIARAATSQSDVRATLDESAAAEAHAAGLRSILADTNASAADKASAQAQLDALTPKLQQIVPGSQPTTYQLTGDQGLGQLERSVGGGSGGNNPAFIARTGEQNAARVEQLAGQAPASSSPQEVAGFFRQQLANLDEQQAAEDAAQRQGVRDAVSPLGGTPLVGPDAAGTGLQQQGDALRSDLLSSQGSAKAAMGSLWKAVDPDGTLRVDMTPIRQAASNIAKAMPQNAAPMEGTEAAIFGTAQMLPKVQPFAELGALRSRLTDAMSKELEENGSSQSYRRMTQLLGSVDDALSGAVETKAAAEASAVAAGQMPAEDTMLNNMAQQRADWYSDRNVRAAQARGYDGANSGGYAGSGPQTVSGVAGAEVYPRGSIGGASRAPGLQGQAGEGLAPNFDAAAAERYRAARRGTGQYHQTYTDKRTAPGVAQVLAPGSRSGEFREPASAVPSLLFGPGKGAAERVQAYLRAGGSADKVRDYLAFSLRTAAEKEDGTLKTAALERWLSQNNEALEASGLKRQFASAAKAQGVLDKAVADRATARKDFEKSAAGRFLGEGDPVSTVGKILSSDAGEATMRELARRTAGNRDARGGLQKASIDYILNELRSNAPAGDTDVRQMKADMFQTFLRKAAPGLRQIFSPQQVKAIEDVALDLQRTQRSVVGTKLPGGSNTAHDLLAARKHGNGHSSSIMGFAWMETLGHLAAHFTNPIGGAAASIGTAILNGARASGMSKIDDLVTEAMLHPELARALLAKVPAGGFGKSVVQNALSQIRSVATMSAANQLMSGPQGR
jgi:hypothetical protein